MAGVAFDQLFLQADNFRNNAQVAEAVRAYVEIARLAAEENQPLLQGQALHLAGVSLKENVLTPGSAMRDAEGYFDQAEQIFRQVNATEDLGALYRDRAIITDYARQGAAALPWFQKSIEILSQHGYDGHLGMTYVKLGLHYYQQEQYQQASELIAKGRKLLDREPSHGFFQATALYDQARVAFKLQQIDQAQELAETSLSWFEADHERVEHKRRQAQLHGLLSLIYERQQAASSARAHARSYQQLLKTFDLDSAAVIKRDLDFLAS